MNKFRKTLIGFLSASCLVCTGLFMAACTDPETPPQPATTYTITLDYNAEQGTVTKTPDTAKYEEGDVVTISVSANDGYEVDTFTVSTDAAAVLSAEGTYTLTVTADTTVSATFKEVVEPTGTYTVTLDYNAEQGSVTLNPKKDAYIGGEEVTLTVLANEGYAVDTFTVSSDATAALNEVGNYTLTVWENTTVSVTFKTATVTPEEGKFPEFMQGTWNGIGAEGYVVTITETALAITADGSAVEATFSVSTITGEFGETMTTATVTFDGVTYELVTYAQDNVLAFESETATLYFVTENLPEYSFSEAVYGTWTSDELDAPVVIDANGLFFGRAALLVYALNDEEFAYYEYAVIVDGVLYNVMLSGETLYFGDYALTKYVANAPDEVPFDSAYAGTWTDGENTLVIAEDGSATWNGAAVVPFNDGMAGFYVNGEYNWISLSAVNELYVMGANVTLTKQIASLEKAGMVGTWKSLGSDPEYTITATATSFSLKSYDPAWNAYDDVSGILNVEFVEDFGETYLNATFYWYTNGGFVAYEVILMGGDNLLTIQYTDYETWEVDAVLFVKDGLTALTPDESLYGTWVDEEGMYEESLVVSAEGVSWGETELTVIYAYEEDGAQIAYLISDKSAFMIMYTEGYFYFFDIITYEPYAMLVKAEEGETDLPAWLLGTSYLNVDGMGVLTISAKGAINWLGYDLTVVEFEDTSDMFSSSFTATVSLEGTVYTLVGNANSFTATNNDDGIETVFTFVALADKVNAAFRGTWMVAGGEVVFVIDDTTVNYGGYLELTAFAYDGSALYVDSGMGVWELALYANNADVLLVTINSYGYTMTAAYVKQGADVGVYGIDWPGLVGTWETADGEILTINQDGSATWAGHTVIVLSSSEKLTNGKQDFMTLIVDYDLVETVVDIVDNVPGEMKITLESEGKTYTFTKTSNSGGEEGGFSFANTVWTNGVWKFSFDGIIGIDVYQNGNYYKWISDLTLNGTSFRAVYLDDDGMEAQITGELSEDGNSITVYWIDQGLFGATFTKEGAGSEPSENPFAGTWYANWDGWVLTIVDEDDVTLTNGTVTYTGTYFYSAFFGTIEFSFNDEEGVIGAYSFTCDVNGDFSSFAVSLRSGIEIEIGTTFSKTPSSGGPDIEPDPDAKFAEEHLGAWTFISEDDGYELPDLILYKDGSLTWGDLTGWLYFVEDYADEWGVINYTVYLFDYADFYVLQYSVEDETMNLWLGAGMDYYFTKGEGGGEDTGVAFAAEDLGTWECEGVSNLVLYADGTVEFNGKLGQLFFATDYTDDYGYWEYYISFDGGESFVMLMTQDGVLIYDDFEGGEYTFTKESK